MNGTGPTGRAWHSGSRRSPYLLGPIHRFPNIPAELLRWPGFPRGRHCDPFASAAGCHFEKVVTMNNMVDQSESDYLKGNCKPLTTESSVLISSSKYLNSARLRDVVAQEMLRKWGHDVPPAFLVPETMQAFMELIDYPQLFGLFEAEKATKPEFREWLDARFISNIKAEDVADCKPGTLGQMIHDFITKSGLTLDFQFRFEPSNDLEYFHKRFSQGHDIQHMVTGMGVDPVGETGLIIMNMQSYFNYFGAEFAGEMNVIPTFMTSCNLMRAGLHYPKALPAMVEAIRIGQEMGDNLKRPLFFVKWEDYFHNTIAEIREDLNIVIAPKDGQWDWTLDYMRG